MGGARVAQLTHSIDMASPSFRYIVSQARLSLRRRESGQIPIRLLYCILSSRAPDEVGVNINGTRSANAGLPSLKQHAVRH